MKKNNALLIILGSPVLFVLFTAGVLYHSGSPGGKTGSLGDGGSNCTDCHAGMPNAAFNWIETDIPSQGYMGGETYTITLTGMHTGVSRFGFELTAETDLNEKIGTFAITDPTETQLANGSTAVTHTSQGINPSGDSKTWSMDWTAPMDPPGDITFYAALNAANGNGNTSGDVIYLTQQTVSPDFTGLSDQEVAGFDIYPNPASGTVTVENTVDSDSKELTFYSIDGHVVLRETVTSTTQRIDISGLNSGIYYIKTENGPGFQKLMVK